VATELAIRPTTTTRASWPATRTSSSWLPSTRGDFPEITGRVVRVGTTSRTCEFECRKVIQPRYEINDSAAELLDEPVLTTRATGTFVVQKDRQRI
jgi:3-aminobutyryl-CoA ammonia-lyase